MKRLALPRLTIDVDGTMVRAGATVGWAFRGFNPHHRKDPSYYPLLAHVAQTGHILRVKNRPGNVHDSKQAVAFLREVIHGLRSQLGRRLPLEFRMDAAFFKRDVFRLLTARRCAYARQPRELRGLAHGGAPGGEEILEQLPACRSRGSRSTPGTGPAVPSSRRASRRVRAAGAHRLAGTAPETTPLDVSTEQAPRGT